MIIVSGVSRSGTSLMMECMRKTFGDDRIFGEKFPQEKRLKYLDEPYPNEDEYKFACRQYLLKDEDKQRIKEDFQQSVDMNPNGFWESLYAVQGVYYRFHDRENLNKWLTEDKPTICKIVCRGLWQSDPKYIDKIIYMVRHPFDVAKSQERLKRDLPGFQTENGVFKLEHEFKVNSPKMYIGVTAMACRWLVEYSEVPVLQVYYDSLLDEPVAVFKEVQDFLGEGDFSPAVDSIDTSLRRSRISDVPDSRLWDIALAVYDLFTTGDYQGVLDYLKDKNLNEIDGEGGYMCPRSGRMVTLNECRLCRNRTDVKINYRKAAEARGVDWRKEPCLWECGMGPGPDYKSIEESIKNNHWK